jgi:hypothetical protein
MMWKRNPQNAHTAWRHQGDLSSDFEASPLEDISIQAWLKTDTTRLANVDLRKLGREVRTRPPIPSAMNDIVHQSRHVVTAARNSEEDQVSSSKA